MVLLVEPPAATVAEAGLAEMLKSGRLVIVSAKEAEWVFVPSTPVTVSV
jgi:hypothetical protein